MVQTRVSTYHLAQVDKTLAWQRSVGTLGRAFRSVRCADSMAAISHEQMQQLLTGLGQMIVQALQAQQQQAAGGRESAGDGGGKTQGKRELDGKGYDNIETFAGGEEAWSSWSWTMKVATRAMCEELVDLMNFAETNHGKGTEELLNEVDMLEAKYDRKRCVKASAEQFSFLTRFTSSEARTIVKGAKDMDGVEAYGLLHENYSKRTMCVHVCVRVFASRPFVVHHACMCNSMHVHLHQRRQ